MKAKTKKKTGTKKVATPESNGARPVATKTSSKAPPGGKVAKQRATKAVGAAKAKSNGAPKRISALDAAAQVLRTSGQAMRSGEMITAMADKGLWQSPNGKTPHATLYAAILREINDKGRDARFRKVERGKFEFAGK